MSINLLDFNQAYCWRIEDINSAPQKLSEKESESISATSGMACIMKIGLLRTNNMFIATFDHGGVCYIRIGDDIIDMSSVKERVVKKRMPFLFMRRFTVKTEKFSRTYYYRKLWFDQEWPYPGDIFDYIADDFLNK